jgi:hypothetical protein
MRTRRRDSPVEIELGALIKRAYESWNSSISWKNFEALCASLDLKSIVRIYGATLLPEMSISKDERKVKDVLRRVLVHAPPIKQGDF